MSLQNRAFFLFDASDTDGPLWLRCRKVTLQEAMELEELIRRTRSAYTPARPTDDEDEDPEPMTAEERQEKMLEIIDGADRYVIHLVRAYSETEAAPTKDADAWLPCRIVADEADSGSPVEGVAQVWIESFTQSIRQEIMVRALSEFSEAQKKVSRFRSANAAAAAPPAT